MNVYTEFKRSDGHVIWAHMDQWEGQKFTVSPGNLYSDVQEVHLGPKSYRIELHLAHMIPQQQLPADSHWVKRIKLQSKLLTQFWGRPIYLGATVLLPKDYDQHPNVRYPVIYEQGHFSLRAPLSFRSEPLVEDGQQIVAPSGYELFQRWSGPGFPRMIAVTLQHPTPFFDDSYAVNSENNGPYGDAIMRELIPYVEKNFRIIRQPWARALTGVSTGGWEALALLFFHPDFFGGTWAFSPDPVDFQRYQLIDIYEDNNAFIAPGFEWLQPERPLMRTVEGQVIETMRQMSQFEAVLGSHGRSGQQLDAWNAAYSPVGSDGYPQPLWDKSTGDIDHEVAFHMRDRGYDLRYYLEQNWQHVGPHLADKIHIYCGDMDNYYLNLSVYLMEDFLKATTAPAAHAVFTYGRPMKGHGWSPVTQTELVQEIAGYMSKHAPAGADIHSWKY
jgi:S-formylglutathione hydrolase FrmB